MKDTKIAVVTDSTSDIPLSVANELGITIVPLRVIFGHEVYRDGIDIRAEEFYEKLAQSNPLPKTSQPGPHDFAVAYEELLDSHDQVLSIHISEGLSSTIQSAKQAAKQFVDRVSIWDTKSISLGIGVQVIRAVEALRDGLSMDSVLEKLHRIRKNSEVLFTLDTLEYLHKGGRIGKAASLLGSVLNIKPIIRVEDGIYHAFGKARSKKRALDMLVSKFQGLAAGRKAVTLAVGHGVTPDEAEYLQERLEQIFNIKSKLLAQVGPVIGVHTGPGAVGAAVCFE